MDHRRPYPAGVGTGALSDLPQWGSVWVSRGLLGFRVSAPALAQRSALPAVWEWVEEVALTDVVRDLAPDFRERFALRRILCFVERGRLLPRLERKPRRAESEVLAHELFEARGLRDDDDAIHDALISG